MRPQEKTDRRIDYSTRATIQALKSLEARKPGSHITKTKLFPIIARHVNYVIENADNIEDILEAVGFPDESFIERHWSEINMRCAEEYNCYIVWNRKGVRLGTFEEYQKLNPTMARIAVGTVKRIKHQSRIIENQGGSPYNIEIKISLLGSGKTEE